MVLVEEVNQTLSGDRSCAYCHDVGSSKVCALCREVAYCSRGCQQAHWKVHRKECSRKYDLPPKEQPEVENPCVRCGKKGLMQSSGVWYCSHDCCSSEVGDLTAKIKGMTQSPPASAGVKEMNRLKDFISSSISQQSSSPGGAAASGPGKPATTPEAGRPRAADQNAKLLGLIEQCSQPVSQKAAATPEISKPGAPDPNAHVRALIEQCSKPGDVANFAAVDPNSQKAAMETQAAIFKNLEEQRELAKKAEKARQEQARFAEWVQWAQGEIQKKRDDEESDHDV